MKNKIINKLELLGMAIIISIAIVGCSNNDKNSVVPNDSTNREAEVVPTPEVKPEVVPTLEPSPDVEPAPEPSTEVVPTPEPSTEVVPTPEVTPDVKPDSINPNDNFNYLEYDPFYPESFTDTSYILNVPALNGRFTLNEDKTIATIFAPGVSKDNGYYDTNKNFYNDNRLCWAATSSNMIAWYLDRLEDNNINLDGIERDVNKIFDIFRANWNYLEGYDFTQGLAWYFTGNTLTGSLPDNLLNKNSGGYLKNLANVGEVWSVIGINHISIIGNYELKHPFLDDNLRLDETEEVFSRNVVGALHYGPLGIMILAKGATANGSHAITLWGADFDATTGLIKAIYVTDSDDEAEHSGSYLRRVRIKKSRDDYHGIEMIDYCPTRGNPSPFLYVGAGCTLFSPDVVGKIKEV